MYVLSNQEFNKVSHPFFFSFYYLFPNVSERTRNIECIPLTN